MSHNAALSRTLSLLLLLAGTACSQAGGTAAPASPSPLPSPTAMPSPTTAPTPTISTEEARVEALLADMTTEQKVGQLFVVYFTDPHFSPDLAEMITQYHVGGIIIFGRNVTTLQDLAELINEAQSAAVTTEPEIPLFVATDQEGWPILRLWEGATVFPSSMAVGATDSVLDAQLMAGVMAAELEAVGINMNLAPVLDVNTNPANPIIGIRSLSSSPELVSRLGTAMIEAYQAQGIIATAKHFPGHGDTSLDSHLSLPTISHDLARMEAVELVPFEAAISAGVDCIMTAHISAPSLDPVPYRPATLSPPVLQGLLREQMGFEGLIATDSLGMRALTDQYDVPSAASLAFQAGADLLMFGDDPGHDPSEQRAAYQRVLGLVEQGTVPMSRLDDSVRGILLLKARRGILDWQPVVVDRIVEQVGTAQHLAAAQQVALDSITLVKDEDGLLPLDPQFSTLVVYPQGGRGLAEAMQRHGSSIRVLEVSQRPSTAEVEQVVVQAQGADVVVLGTSNVQRFAEQARLVESLHGHHPLITVALDSPYDLLSYPQVSTYLVTYGRAPVSLEALAEVLFGLQAPRGRLPVELPPQR
ncbi:MAG: beta-N-acetylhexosaminidase [Chloroflexi bacterium B3_Chlor]|nr:MAG: beta-N-acetylhexosaminidase [Chloroflexi bacterium B3_Chlor]